MIIRPITSRDLDPLYAIAVESGPGFTSLLPDRDALARKIDHSVSSFGRTVTTPGDEHYLFVLEDSMTGEILGTTGIDAAAGLKRPLIHFRRNTIIPHARGPRMKHADESLTRCQHYTGCTEICSLYLRPGFRRANAGKLLSRVRFLFMALHPERFSDTVIAEMRGVSDQAGHSPFWNWLKHHVADLDFASATQLACSAHAGFVEEFIPATPFYTQHMNPEARAVIGQVHEDTRPARHMLEREGFRHRGFVDLLDGGPTLECPKAEIASVRNTHMGKIELQAGGEKLRENIEGPDAMPAILANAGCSGFRATVTDQVHRSGDCLMVPARLAENLGLDAGSLASYLPLAGSRQQADIGQQASQPLAHEEIRYAF